MPEPEPTACPKVFAHIKFYHVINLTRFKYMNIPFNKIYQTLIVLVVWAFIRDIGQSPFDR